MTSILSRIFRYKSRVLHPGPLRQKGLTYRQYASAFFSRRPGEFPRECVTKYTTQDTRFRALVGIFILQLSFGLYADSKVSLYSAKGAFTDDSGKSFALGQLKGKKIVFAMAYTSCKGSCPLIVKRMQKLESTLQQQKVVAEFVIVSFDSERDTPENLKRFRKLMKVTAPSWHFLSAPDSATRDLANMLNIRFARIPDSGEYSHDNKILLIDEQGYVVRTLESLSDPLEALY